MRRGYRVAYSRAVSALENADGDHMNALDDSRSPRCGFYHKTRPSRDMVEISRLFLTFVSICLRCDPLRPRQNYR